MGARSEPVDPDAVSETLKCPLCLEIFDDPVFCGGRPCQHVFCRGCVERALQETGHCPSCRGEMTASDLQPHQVIRSLLDEVLVRCDRGCGWTGRHDALVAHRAECPLLRLELASAQLALLADVQAQLAQRDARIAALEARVAEQDRQAVAVGKQLVAREVEIQELRAGSARIAALEARLAEQDRQAVTTGMQLVAREVEVQELRANSAQQECELARLRTWLSSGVSATALGAEPPSPGVGAAAAADAADAAPAHEAAGDGGLMDAAGSSELWL